MGSESTSFEQGRRAQVLLATQPTAWTKALRTSILWQAIRFIVINLKMVRVIRKSHG